MEVVQHLLGACADNHSHFDLTDVAYMGTGAMGLYALRYYTIVGYYVVKNYIKPKK